MQLFDAEADNHIWSEEFDRELIDIFSIQRDVAIQVANGLKAKLTPVEEQNLGKKPTHKPEAYEFYLQGVYQLRSGSMDGLRKSFPLLRQAITLDPDFAEAYAEIAKYYISEGNWRGSLSAKAARDEAIPYIQKALEINPDLSAARSCLATLKFWFDWDFEGAEQEYMKCNCPGDYGFFLLMMGRFDEVAEKFAISYALDPFDAHDRPNRGMESVFLKPTRGSDPDPSKWHQNASLNFNRISYVG